MDVLLFGPIGPDSLLKVVDTVASDEDINVHIGSPGGSVYDGLAMYNLLSQSKNKVNVHIDGIAGSIAAIIAMAGNTINIHESGMMMIHNAASMFPGSNKEDLQKTIDVLGKIDQTQVNIISRRTRKSKKDIQALMEKETFFTAKEALAFGLVDTIIKPQKIAAQLNIDKMDNLLKDIQSKFNSLIGTNLKDEDSEEADKLKEAADKIAADKLKASIEAGETSADKITAIMVKTTVFDAKMILLNDYIKSSYEHTLKAQAFIEKFDQAVKDEVKIQMDALLAQVQSKTEVPAPIQHFTEAEQIQSQKDKDAEQVEQSNERERKRVLTP